MCFNCLCVRFHNATKECCVIYLGIGQDAKSIENTLKIGQIVAKESLCVAAIIDETVEPVNEMVVQLKRSDLDGRFIVVPCGTFNVIARIPLVWGHS